jgi:hypothetical protein
MVACLSADACEKTTGQNLSIRLNSERINPIVCVGIERSIESPVGVQSCDVVALHSHNTGEGARDEDLAIRLNRSGPDIAGVQHCIERPVNASVDLQPGDVIPRHRASSIRCEA